jgi:phage/plasmid-like protein (TIGR03299 family)
MNKTETALYTKNPAWHGLGVVVRNAPDIESAIRLAGLEWKVIEESIFYEELTGGPDPITFDLKKHKIESHKALVRSSDKRVLGVVGQSYTPLQNSEAFRFFEPVTQSGLVDIEAAGSLRGGQRVWILGKIRKATGEVVKGDQIDGYLLLYNSHDGSLAVGIQLTCVRSACMNTLAMSGGRVMKNITNGVRIRHTANMKHALEVIQGTVAIATEGFQGSLSAFRMLQQKRITISGLENYVREVLDHPNNPEEPTMPRAWDDIQLAYLQGPGSEIPGVKGTYWGAYNAVAHWLTHTRGKTNETRLDGVWFGDSRKKAERALSLALSA